MNGMNGGAPASSPNVPLSPAGVNLSNPTQASAFLATLLNDDQLKISGSAYARYFWYGISTVIALAAAFNFFRWLILKFRLREAARKRPSPARPKYWVLRWFATLTAMGREVGYLHLPIITSKTWFQVPPLGTIVLVLAYLGFVLVLEFANNNVPGAGYWQALGVRAGWLAVAQVPLLVLLVGKFNFVGLFTGSSCERLNVLHRWAARVTLMLAIFHFAFQNYGWQKYGLLRLEWTTDSCPPTGVAAFAILLWMNLSTLAPLRYWSYEFFVVQHIVTFFGFIIAVMFHLPSTALWSRVYIYIPIGLYLIDRIRRTYFVVLNAFFTGRATMTQLPGNATMVRVCSKAITNWMPGEYILLSIPRFGIMQSHPATICSTPRSHNGDLVLILKGRKGFTKRIYSGANDSTTPLMLQTDGGANGDTSAQTITHWTVLNGPYGGSQSDFAAFHSVALISGSTGVTFTLALLQNLADRAVLGGHQLPVRYIHFVWCIKDVSWTSWISKELAASAGKLSGAGIEVDIDIHVTCADAFTETGGNQKLGGCDCDQSKGPCCCVAVDIDNEKEDDPDEIRPTTDPSPSSSRSLNASSEKGALLSQGRKLDILPCATFYSGRPAVGRILGELLDGADGESGVAVCGPVGLNSAVRNGVVKFSDDRAIHKGTGAQGCYLHVEAFS